MDVERDPKIPTTQELVELLDGVTQDVPKLLESLGYAIGTLVDSNADPEKADAWERNLKGYSGQYYGRLATCQNSLRMVVRHLHALQSDPHSIRPPTRTQGLSSAFSHSTPDKPYSPQKATANTDEQVGSNSSTLSLYGQRLRQKTLFQLQNALSDLSGSVSLTGNEQVG